MIKTRIVALLSGLTLSAAPALVCADQIAPNPNPSGSTISVYDAENFTDFENDGSINVGGTLNNSGTLNNNSGGSIILENSGGRLDNNGTVENFGAIDSDSYNTGVVNNYSIFTNSGSMSIFFLQNTDQLTNNTGATVLVDGLSNSGTLSNSGSISTNAMGPITNSGTLNNSGLLDNGSNGTLINSSVLNNSGTMYSGLSLDNSGTLNNSGTMHSASHTDNSGTINNSGLMDNNPVVIMNNSGTLNNSGTVNNYGAIIGTGTYTQTAGQTILNDSYGDISGSGGEIYAGGSISQASIQIDGGSLSGNGTITGNVTIGSGGSVNPGNSPGKITVNGDFTSGGTLVFEIAGLGSGQYDVLNINGNALFTGGNIQFDFINGFNAAAGNYWDFLYSDTVTGWDALNFTFDGLGAGLGWEFAHLDTGAERLWITSIPVSPVPEPGSYAMLLAGLGMIGFMARRKKVLAE